MFLRIIMEARDPSRNQARAYTLEAELDLWGDFVVSTSFGRIGSRGRTHRQAFSSAEEAIPTIRSILSQRLKTTRKRAVPYTILTMQDPDSLMMGNTHQAIEGAFISR